MRRSSVDAPKKRTDPEEQSSPIGHELESSEAWPIGASEGWKGVRHHAELVTPPRGFVAKTACTLRCSART